MCCVFALIMIFFLQSLHVFVIYIILFLHVSNAAKLYSYRVYMHERIPHITAMFCNYKQPRVFIALFTQVSYYTHALTSLVCCSYFNWCHLRNYYMFHLQCTCTVVPINFHGTNMHIICTTNNMGLCLVMF